MSKASDTAELAQQGYRGYVTVVFSDLCDYTRLSEAIDPEDLHQVCSKLENLAAPIVAKYSGHVTQVYGDGQLWVFGLPQPNEEDARRAIDAALAMHAAVRATLFSELPRGFELRMHTGIHAGLVFANRGTEVHGRYRLRGDVVNTAARLCAAAQRDQILVSGTAFGTGDSAFDHVSVPALTLKGKREPQSAFKVTGRSQRRPGTGASSQRSRTGFVGRHTELSTLHESMLSSRVSHSRLVVVRGQAGIGKTRLLAEYSERARAIGFRVLHGTCDDYDESFPLQPFAQMLRGVFEAAFFEPPGRALMLLEQQCQSLSTELIEHLPTYQWLMALRQVKPEELGTRSVIEALQPLLSVLASSQPLTLVLDDWQWADDASRTLLVKLHAGLSQSDVCIVVGMREDDSVDPLLEPDQLIELQPLTDEDSASVVAELRPDASKVMKTVLRRAGGNPLFLEELCHALPPALFDMQRASVPATLPSMIQARVARASAPDQLLLRVASVLGNEFGASMLVEVTALSAVEVDACLANLTKSGILCQGSTRAIYQFKHGLFRDVVYESALISERKQLHAKVASLIERDTSASDETRSNEVLAYHYHGAGDHARAARCSERAGDRALAVFALDRARYHYHAALEALAKLPTDVDVRRDWLSITGKWAGPFLFGPTRSQLEVFATARKYADDLSDLPAKARCANWLGLAHYDLGDYPESIVQFQNALSCAQDIGDSALRASILAGLGQSQVAAGDYAVGIPTLTEGIEAKRALARARPARAGRVAQGFAYALSCLALAHADCGDFELADAEFDEALSAINGIEHAIHGSILGLKCIALLWRGKWQSAHDEALTARQNSEYVNSAFCFANSSSYGAYASWQLSGHREHIVRMRTMVDWLEAKQFGLYLSVNYAWLANGLMKLGEQVSARDYVNRALQRASHGDPFGEAMAYRVLAQLEVEREHVEQCLERATRAGEARGSRHESVNTNLLRAELAQRVGALGEAEQHAKTGLEQARALDMPAHVQRAQSLISTLSSTDRHQPTELFVR